VRVCVCACVICVCVCVICVTAHASTDTRTHTQSTIARALARGLVLLAKRVHMKAVFKHMSSSGSGHTVAWVHPTSKHICTQQHTSTRAHTLIHVHVRPHAFTHVRKHAHPGHTHAHVRMHIPPPLSPRLSTHTSRAARGAGRGGWGGGWARSCVNKGKARGPCLTAASVYPGGHAVPCGGAVLLQPGHVHAAASAVPKGHVALLQPGHICAAAGFAGCARQQLLIQCRGLCEELRWQLRGGRRQLRGGRGQTQVRRGCIGGEDGVPCARACLRQAMGCHVQGRPASLLLLLEQRQLCAHGHEVGEGDG